MNQAALQDLGKLILRVALGALILLHGIAKVRSGLDPIAGMLQAHGLPVYLAYGALVGEVLAPLLLILGLYARIGAVLVVVNMAFAFALAHMGQVMQLNEQGGWALELQGMFLATALALLLLGPGKYAINQR